MKPILFNTEMVRAILEDRKTVTRRAVKDPYYIDDEKVSRVSGLALHKGTDITHGMPYPDRPYQPGDILWVRETWCRWYTPLLGWSYCYKATDQNGNRAPTGPEYDDESEVRPWHPSIHMPREAARLFLRVKCVRAERLQEITTEEICKEGVWIEPPSIVKSGAKFPADFEKRSEAQREDWYQSTARATYIGQCDHIAALHREWERLWDSTIKPADLPRYGWDVNPWVWVIEFERISKEEAQGGGGDDAPAG